MLTNVISRMGKELKVNAKVISRANKKLKVNAKVISRAEKELLVLTNVINRVGKELKVKAIYGLIIIRAQKELEKLACYQQGVEIVKVKEKVISKAEKELKVLGNAISSVGK